jgi:hypothetical protein
VVEGLVPVYTGGEEFFDGHETPEACVRSIQKKSNWLENKILELSEGEWLSIYLNFLIRSRWVYFNALINSIVQTLDSNIKI